MLRVASLLLALGFMGSCPPNPNPTPTPEPTPDLPPDNGRICEPVGETCGCWHKPPGEDWQYLGDCNPDPEPTPTPIPGNCIFPQGIPDNEFVQGAVRTTHAEAVNNIMMDITGCSIGSDCPTGLTADEWMHQVIDRLKFQGLCAGRHRDTTPGGTDEIAVTSDCTDWWESYKIYNYGGGKVIWSPGANRPSWKIPSSYCDEVDPTPPPPNPGPDVCGSPTPPNLSHFRGPKEKSCSPWCDATPYVCDAGYCSLIGFTDGRRCCSVRTEGAEDRRACERLVIGGNALWRASDNKVMVKPSNHLLAKCTGNCLWIEACSADGGICNRKDF